MRWDEIAIREAYAGDANAVTSLLAELGYPDERDAVEKRLEAASASENDRIFVALDGTVPVGLSSVHLIPLLHRSSSVARITAFVVAESVRRRGVGVALVRACEQFAASRGAERLEVTSGDSRAGAHAFYQAQGLRREGIRFSKPVPTSVRR